MRNHVVKSVGWLFSAGALLSLSACGTGQSWMDGVPLSSSKVSQSRVAPNVGVANSGQQSTFGFPRLVFPGAGGVAGGAMPASEVQCRVELQRMGVRFADLAPIREGSCGIENPVKVSSLARDVALTPAATLNCQTALMMAHWVQDNAQPSARSRYFSGIAEVRQMSSYSCRKIARSNTYSEHSKGNALDIGSIKLNNGRVIDVARPSLFAFREKGFLHQVRADACKKFGTVLGPGDRDHGDHFHFDLRNRNKNYCSMG